MKSILLILVLALAVTASANDADPYHAARGACKLGDPVSKCRSQLTLRELTPTEAKDILNRHPFVATHSFLSPLLAEKRVVVWTDDKPTHQGWPLYIFASFSADDKLTDLIGTAYGFTHPLVHGTYSKHVNSISKGMSVAKMYELVGRQNAEYTQTKDGKWIVTFYLSGYKGQQFFVEADAATGIIITARNGTI